MAARRLPGMLALALAMCGATASAGEAPGDPLAGITERPADARRLSPRRRARAEPRLALLPRRRLDHGIQGRRASRGVFDAAVRRADVAEHAAVSPSRARRGERRLSSG